MKKIIKTLIIVLLIGIMLISSFLIYKNFKEDKEQEEILEEVKIIAFKSGDKEEESTEEINMQKLYEINSDIVAWINIENTNINYPVMQNKDYYLRRNFYKQYSYWGTPYLSENCNIKTSDNLLVYGHHINNTKMFGELEKYKNKSYYEEHKNIKLYTLEENQEYEIISVFKTVAYTGFEYYNFINAKNEGEFNIFIDKCKELSFYNIENVAIYGDKLLTLSTCDYSSKNGRLVIVAKKIKEKIQKKEEEKINDEEDKTKKIENKKILTENKMTSTKKKIAVTSTCNQEMFSNGYLKHYPSFASNYATLKINKINVNAPIYMGATDELLLKGIVHDTGSYFPGENGSIIMCGHNYMNNFNRLRRTIKWRYSTNKYILWRFLL